MPLPSLAPTLCSAQAIAKARPRREGAIDTVAAVRPAAQASRLPPCWVHPNRRIKLRNLDRCLGPMPMLSTEEPAVRRTKPPNVTLMNGKRFAIGANSSPACSNWFQEPGEKNVVLLEGKWSSLGAPGRASYFPERSYAPTRRIIDSRQRQGHSNVRMCQVTSDKAHKPSSCNLPACHCQSGRRSVQPCLKSPRTEFGQWPDPMRRTTRLPRRYQRSALAIGT